MEKLTIEIEPKKLAELLINHAYLRVLEAGGVDNWHGSYLAFEDSEANGFDFPKYEQEVRDTLKSNPLDLVKFL